MAPDPGASDQGKRTVACNFEALVPDETHKDAIRDSVHRGGEYHLVPYERDRRVNTFVSSDRTGCSHTSVSGGTDETLLVAPLVLKVKLHVPLGISVSGSLLLWQTSICASPAYAGMQFCR